MYTRKSEWSRLASRLATRPIPIAHRFAALLTFTPRFLRETVAHSADGTPSGTHAGQTCSLIHTRK